MNGIPPFKLSEDEWNQIAAALRNTRFASTAQKLKTLNNLPQLPHDIFDDKSDWNQGEEAVNMLFRRLGAPFHLKRIGTTGGLRSERRLAIVRWHYAQQLRMPFDLGVRRYRSYKSSALQRQ